MLTADDWKVIHFDIHLGMSERYMDLRWPGRGNPTTIFQNKLERENVPYTTGTARPGHRPAYVPSLICTINHTDMYPFALTYGCFHSLEAFTHAAISDTHGNNEGLYTESAAHMATVLPDLEHANTDWIRIEGLRASARVHRQRRDRENNERAAVLASAQVTHNEAARTHDIAQHLSWKEVPNIDGEVRANVRANRLVSGVGDMFGESKTLADLWATVARATSGSDWTKTYKSHTRQRSNVAKVKNRLEKEAGNVEVEIIIS